MWRSWSIAGVEASSIDPNCVSSAIDTTSILLPKPNRRTLLAASRSQIDFGSLANLLR